ncbi:hypothetical protein ACFV6F_30665 [Kitasatospora phosalacinea]|uniref:hypothetical protein n=1 Tax=Kitasatospora phosalacinea TaxID=2065 RepID=UPI0036485CA4
MLSQADWHHTGGLDIYLAPTHEREAGLDAIATADEQLRNGRYTIAVQRHLAADVQAYGVPARERVRAQGLPGAQPGTARAATEAKAGPSAPPTSAAPAGARGR